MGWTTKLRTAAARLSCWYLRAPWFALGPQAAPRAPQPTEDRWLLVARPGGLRVYPLAGAPRFKLSRLKPGQYVLTLPRGRA